MPIHHHQDLIITWLYRTSTQKNPQQRFRPGPRRSPSAVNSLLYGVLYVMREPLSGLGASASAGIPNYGDALIISLIELQYLVWLIGFTWTWGLGLGLGELERAGREWREGMDGDGIDFMEEGIVWYGLLLRILRTWVAVSCQCLLVSVSHWHWHWWLVAGGGRCGMYISLYR